jgi:hypothetical protein
MPPGEKITTETLGQLYVREKIGNQLVIQYNSCGLSINSGRNGKTAAHIIKGGMDDSMT